MNGFHPLIDYTLCQNCTQRCCCMYNAHKLVLDDRGLNWHQVIQPDRCIGCEDCVRWCKRGAIKILRLGSHQEAADHAEADRVIEQELIAGHAAVVKGFYANRKQNIKI